MTEEVRKVLEQVVRYCEDQAIYDKLSKYDDFYYKAKKLLAEGLPNDFADRWLD